MKPELGSVGLHKRREISLERLISEIKRNPEINRAGAIACFTGIVREEGAELDDVQQLEYEAYQKVALEKLDEIRREMLGRPGIIDISLHHIIDKLKVSEESIYVVVAGKHRKDVFPALVEAVERVKREVPIWKKEVSQRSAAWIATDH